MFTLTKPTPTVYVYMDWQSGKFYGVRQPRQTQDLPIATKFSDGTVKPDSELLDAIGIDCRDPKVARRIEAA